MIDPTVIQQYQRSIGYISQPGGGFMPDPGAADPGTVLPLAQQYPQFAEYLETQAGQEEGIVPVSNGYAPLPSVPSAPGVPSVPGAMPIIALPAIAAVGLWIIRLAPAIARFALARGMSFLGAVSFIRRSGMTILKWGGIAALGAWLIDMIDVDPEQASQAAQEILVELQQKELKKKRRRYTIGYNPRVRTLQRVARHTMRMLKRHDKYIREFFPKPRYKVPPPARRYLSPIEKAAIK